MAMTSTKVWKLIKKTTWLDAQPIVLTYDISCKWYVPMFRQFSPIKDSYVGNVLQSCF